MGEPAAISRRRGFGFEEEGLHGGIFDGLAGPGHGDAVAPQPEGQHVGVVRRQGVARLSTGQGEQGFVPVADVHNHVQGREDSGPGEGVFAECPGLGYRVDVSGEGKGAQVEDGAHDGQPTKRMGKGSRTAGSTPLPAFGRLTQPGSRGQVRRAEGVVNLSRPAVGEPALGEGPQQPGEPA